MMFCAFIAGLFNAAMDKVDHHFYQSVFDWIKDPKWRLWFNEDKGWLNKYNNREVAQGRVKWTILGITFNKPEVFTDSWHHFKFWVVFFCALSPLECSLWVQLVGLELLPLYAFVSFSICWILGFNFGYNKLFTKKMWLLLIKK